MDDLNRLVTPSLGAIIIVLGIVSVGLLVAVIVLVRRLSRLDQRLRGLTRGNDGQDLAQILEAHLDKVYAVAREVGELGARTTGLELAQRKAFQRRGLVRYNPFEDTGGNQSFALALLDQDGDGLIVSSLHARAATRVYAKAIAAGRSEAALSDEESEALRFALGSGAGSAKAG